MILLTTSRRPTRRIRTLCHDLVLSVPNIVRINRGKLNLDGIAERAVELNANRIVAVERWKGGPGKIRLFRIDPSGLVPVPPLMYVAGIRLRREFEAKMRHIRSLTVTMEPENSSETLGIVEQLSGFFDLPRVSTDEASTQLQFSMHVSLDALQRTQITFKLFPKMVEVGPRITLSKVVW